MAARPRMSPRKTPRQERAKDTVETIVSATARILVRDGYESASTNRVAKEAGVSVGSLYQYFPSKEALVVAVLERHFEEMNATLTSRLLGLMNDPVETVARELVAALIAIHKVNPKLHRVLIEQVPRVGRLAKLDELSARLTQLITAYLTAHRDEVEVEDVELAAFLMVKAAEALVHAAVTYRPEIVTNGVLEEQIVRIALGYVRPSAKRKSARRAG